MWIVWIFCCLVFIPLTKYSIKYLSTFLGNVRHARNNLFVCRYRYNTHYLQLHTAPLLFTLCLAFYTLCWALKSTWSGAEKDCQHNKHRPDHSRWEWAGFDLNILILLVPLWIIVSREWQWETGWYVEVMFLTDSLTPLSSQLCLWLTEASEPEVSVQRWQRPAYSRHSPLELHRQFPH